MKNKILTFIIGMLVGAIIATGVFFIINKNNNTSNTTNTENQQMTIPGGNGEQGQPPEMPSGNNMGEPPAKPSDNSNSQTSQNTTENN